MGRFRPTIRLRLTLLYGGLFLLTGAVLLAVNYGLVRRSLEDRLRPVTMEVVGGALFETPTGPEARVLPAPAVGVIAEDPAATEIIERIETSYREEALHELVVQSSVALALLAVASVGLGWLVAGRALRPLAQVTAAARQLSHENLDQRLDLQGPADELKELADTFDDMLARLEAAFDGQRRFVANASHELRTPLSIQRTLVDVALADPDVSKQELVEMAASVRDAVDRSERLIDGLLVLARSERPTLERGPCDLSEVAAMALEQVGTEAAARGLKVDRRLGSAPLVGNRVLLERLVANLVQNAVRYNTDGGWMKVETGTRDGRVEVRVVNSGPVVPPEQVATLFEPFRRLAPDRTGSQRGVGLGLSIVRAVTMAHGGTVQAAARAEGGLDVCVRVPTGHTPPKAISS